MNKRRGIRLKRLGDDDTATREVLESASTKVVGGVEVAEGPERPERPAGQGGDHRRRVIRELLRGLEEARRALES